ncbi:MAG TPA: 50S ribosomal protein L25 [Vicinamibacterales bacterium]|jgi:large subunit ribosomal protein L25
MEATLEASPRDSFGKNEARRIRAAGKVPGVLYGGDKKDATPITVEPRALLKILHSESGQNTLISLKYDGTDTKVLVKDFQLDPITHHVLHADFYRVAMDKVVQVTIPVVGIGGEPKGVKQQGGVLEWVRREIVIACLPGDIPEHVECNVSDLMLHQGIRVRDVATSPKWKAITEPEAMLVHVIMPKAEEAPATPEAAAAAATATPAEPEVIKKGKKEEATEEAAEAKPEKKK